jgi:hypothetical protein
MSWINSLISIINSIGARFYEAAETAGDWVAPFYYLSSPLQWIANLVWSLVSPLLSFNEWASSVTTQIGKILSIDAIRDYFSHWLAYAEIAWNWVVNAYTNVANSVNIWWSSTQYIVQSWIETAKQWAKAQVDNLSYAVAPIISGWNSFVSKIPSLDTIISWFTNWWSNILTNLTSWWNQRLTDIESLLTSLILDLSPFWEGWQDIRDKVFEFFDNPLEWLLKEFTTWFLGGE